MSSVYRLSCASLSRRLLLGPMLTIAMSAYAQSSTRVVASCPMELSTNQSPRVVPDKFLALTDVRAGDGKLTNVSVFAGHPSNLGALIPDGHRDGSMSWDLAGSPNSEHWLVCEYRETRVRLAIQLPLGVSSCRLLFRELRGREFSPYFSQVLGAQCLGQQR